MLSTLMSSRSASRSTSESIDRSRSSRGRDTGFQGFPVDQRRRSLAETGLRYVNLSPHSRPTAATMAGSSTTCGRCRYRALLADALKDPNKAAMGDAMRPQVSLALPQSLIISSRFIAAFCTTKAVRFRRPNQALILRQMLCNRSIQWRASPPAGEGGAKRRMRGSRATARLPRDPSPLPSPARGERLLLTEWNGRSPSRPARCSRAARHAPKGRRGGPRAAGRRPPPRERTARGERPRRARWRTAQA